MGHNTGWLALGSGIAGGADVVMIPEIPHDVGKVADSLLARKSGGSRFSIVAVSEGSLSVEEAATRATLREQRAAASTPKAKTKRSEALKAFEASMDDSTARISKELQDLTGLESRVTILGHVQRGGTPSAVDRLLATRLGAEAAQAVADDDFGIMIASQGGEAVRVPLEQGGRKATQRPARSPLDPDRSPTRHEPG